MDKQLENYLMQIAEPRKEWMYHLEDLAKEDHVPIMDPLAMNFVRQLIRIKNPEKILEIGTAIGYSALMMADASPEAKIISIERDEPRFKQAVEHINAQHKEDAIKVIFGDALEKADEAGRKGPYDLIFIDAAKGQYQVFFELYTPFLKEDGMVITDNVLFKRLVFEEQKDQSKRLLNIAKKVKQFNEWLLSRQDYHTTILPIGDGVAVSIKKRYEKGVKKK